MNLKSFKFFSIVSNETRWKIISTLYKKEKTVTEICKDIKEEQSKVSHSLKAMINCKIVFLKKKGKYSIYSLNKKTIEPLVKNIEIHTKQFCDDSCPYKSDKNE